MPKKWAQVNARRALNCARLCGSQLGMKLMDGAGCVMLGIALAIFAWFLWVVFSTPADPNKVHTPYIQKELRR